MSSGLRPLALGSRLVRLDQPTFHPYRLRGEIRPFRWQLFRRGGRHVGKPFATFNLCDPALVEAEEGSDVVVPVTSVDHSSDERSVTLGDGEAASRCACCHMVLHAVATDSLSDAQQIGSRSDSVKDKNLGKNQRSKLRYNFLLRS